MDIRDQLSLALIMRNVKRNPTAPSTESKIEDVRSYINSFLAYNLPTAIAMDQEVLTLEVDKGLVSPKVWDVLESYVSLLNGLSPLNSLWKIMQTRCTNLI